MAQCLRGKVASAGVSAPWRRAASASYHHTIQAVPRETSGPRAAARERRHGRVPAVLLSLAGASPGNGVAHRKLLTADRKQLVEMVKQSPYFLSTPVRLQVRAGERSNAVVHSGTVLPIKVPGIFSYSHQRVHPLAAWHLENLERSSIFVICRGRGLLVCSPYCSTKCSLGKLLLVIRKCCLLNGTSM
jgi:ribosomal protein L25 (general stress protein Ctc)